MQYRTYGYIPSATPDAHCFGEAKARGASGASVQSQVILQQALHDELPSVCPTLLEASRTLGLLDSFVATLPSPSMQCTFDWPKWSICCLQAFLYALLVILSTSLWCPLSDLQCSTIGRLHEGRPHELAWICLWQTSCSCLHWSSLSIYNVSSIIEAGTVVPQLLKVNQLRSALKCP